MISVYESIARWLMFDVLSQIQPTHVVVDAETIPNWAQFENAGIFASPNDFSTTLMGGQTKNTEFKSFYIKRRFNSEQNRQDNEVFKEKLMRIIREKNLNYEMPNDGRDWISIEVNAGIYPAQRQEDSSFADYLIPLKLEYID